MNDALFELDVEDTPTDSELERSIKALIDEKQAASALTSVQKVYGASALALARAITLGTRKGRSIAGDVLALGEAIARLDADILGVGAGPTALPNNVRQLTEALEVHARDTPLHHTA